MTTSELKPGQEGTVTEIKASPVIRQRLLDMGIIPNVKVKMERTTATGDPIWLRVLTYQLALRREEAASVIVRTEEE